VFCVLDYEPLLFGRDAELFVDLVHDTLDGVPLTLVICMSEPPWTSGGVVGAL
jgi:hypothetical protein